MLKVSGMIQTNIIDRKTFGIKFYWKVGQRENRKKTRIVLSDDIKMANSERVKQMLDQTQALLLKGGANFWWTQR